MLEGVPVSLSLSLPCPAIPARGRWGCRERSGYLCKAGTLGNKCKISHLGKGDNHWWRLSWSDFELLVDYQAMGAMDYHG